VAATLASALATVGQMVAAGRLIAGALDGQVIAWSTGLAWLLGFVVARAAAAGVAELAAQRLATGAKSRLRRSVVSALVREPAAPVPDGVDDETTTGRVATTVVDGVEKLDAFYRRYVPQLAATLLVPACVVTAVAWIDPLSGLILAVTGPLIPLFLWLLGSLTAQRTRAQWQALGRLGGQFLDTLQGLPTLARFNRDREALAELDRANESLRVRTMSVLRVAFLSGFVLELAASLSTAVLAASVGVRLIEGWMTFRPGLTVLLLAPEFYLPFRQLGQRRHAGMEGVAAAEALFALLDARVPVGGTAATMPLAASPSAVRKRAAGPAVSFDAVGFAYRGAAGPVLVEVTLALPPRQLTVLTGVSGAGKSTTLALLLRFVEPDTGVMTLDGIPHHRMTPEAWRSHFALAPQRPRFLDGSLLDNLRLARADASRDEVVAAAATAQADDFIRRLPRGYDTPIDDAASGLSGGERQRLALARAILKPAPILLLDEPTSALDTSSESRVLDALAALAAERTVLLVSHRPAAVQRADRVIRLECGRITDLGADTRARECSAMSLGRTAEVPA
jgi:thiol reductant ABC exporter CydD subunit